MGVWVVCGLADASGVRSRPRALGLRPVVRLTVRSVSCASILRRFVAARKQLRVEHDRHRAVVDQLDAHVRTEAPALGAQQFAQALVKHLGAFRRRRLFETRAAAATSVSEQRELADAEDLAATSTSERSSGRRSLGKIRRVRILCASS